MKSTQGFRRNWGILILFSLVISAGAIAGSSIYHRQEEDRGEHFPWPFDSINRRVELADGEFYTLVGNVVIMPSASDSTRQQAYLEIDLNTHSWLASKKRKDFPYYVLEGSLSFWKDFENARVQVNCQAIQRNREIHLKLVQDGDGQRFKVLE